MVNRKDNHYKKSLYHKHPNYSASCPRQTEKSNESIKKVLTGKERQLSQNRMRKGERPLATAFLPQPHSLHTENYFPPLYNPFPTKNIQYTVQLKENISQLNNLCYPRGLTQS